jgi:hypothetical protein
MPSDEGHIHWDGSADSTVNYLGQELQLTAERSNVANATMVDPPGTIRIRLSGFGGTGLALPTDGWETVPGTAPALEARMDGHYAVGYIRVRQA